MTAQFLEAASNEWREAILYYESQRPGLGARFRADVRQAVEEIESAPLSWQLLDEGIRRCRCRKFPYGVIYRLREDELVIVAVAHLHRKPDYWRDRL